jgi:hypothetical protein
VVACAREPGKDAFASIEMATGGVLHELRDEVDGDGDVRLGADGKPVDCSSALSKHVGSMIVLG